MFGGKKEKALQDELYTIKKQIAEYSDELKEDGFPSDEPQDIYSDDYDDYENIISVSRI